MGSHRLRHLFVRFFFLSRLSLTSGNRLLERAIHPLCPHCWYPHFHSLDGDWLWGHRDHRRTHCRPLLGMQASNHLTVVAAACYGCHRQQQSRLRLW
uniref:Putative secreted peptide n=1 Tax=Anopheles braziliensis TaxID=58242 RepID=A0A2M3ZRP4_9DIPT